MRDVGNSLHIAHILTDPSPETRLPPDWPRLNEWLEPDQATADDDDDDDDDRVVKTSLMSKNSVISDRANCLSQRDLFMLQK